MTEPRSVEVDGPVAKATRRTPGRLPVIARMVLVVAASAAVLASAPTALTAPLSLVAIAVVAERVARTRGRGTADAVLLACGGVLVALVLLGLLLGISGVGLRPRSWSIALGAVALGVLIATEYLTRRGGTESVVPAARYRRPRLRDIPWAIAAVAVACAAITVSVRATDDAEVSPLQMTFATVGATSAQIVVSSDTSSGQLELRTEAGDGTTLSYPLFGVGPDRPVTTSVVLPRSGRLVITLNNPDQTKPLRSLILDR